MYRHECLFYLMKTRVAVVGVGEFGRNHVRVIRESSRAELVAVVDSNGARASEAAAANGCASFTSVRELALNGLPQTCATPRNGAQIHLLTEGVKNRLWNAVKSCVKRC